LPTKDRANQPYQLINQEVRNRTMAVMRKHWPGLRNCDQQPNDPYLYFIVRYEMNKIVKQERGYVDGRIEANRLLNPERNARRWAS